MQPIAILINDKAGKGNASQVFQMIKAVLEARGLAYSLFINEWPLKYPGFSSVWIIGGDGSLNYFINHIDGPVPPLAIFKSGTGNDFACHLYGEADNRKIAQLVLASTPKPVDAGLCNGKVFLNMAGIGFDGHVLKKMGTIRWLGSFLGYYSAIIRSVMTFREPFYELTIDGIASPKQKLLLLLINNAPTTGGGFKVSPDSQTSDGKLELLTCEPLSKWRRLVALPLVRKGKHLDLPYIQYRQVSKVFIKSERSLFAQIDGDLIEARDFEISILPGHLRFLY